MKKYPGMIVDKFASLSEMKNFISENSPEYALELEGEEE